MSKYIVQFKETSEGRFPFLDFGYETHGRKSFRLWISTKLIQKDEKGQDVISFPMNATLIRTEKGSLVLRPGPGVVYDIFVKCGYRGDSKIEILKPQPSLAVKYYDYSSPRGSLGVSHGMLVWLETPQSLTYRWRRTGRTYGEPKKGLSIIHPDGRVEEIDELPDGLEALHELRELLS